MYLTDGNIHHTSHFPGQLLGARLFTGGGNRTPIEGMYMCGAETHHGERNQWCPRAQRRTCNTLGLRKKVESENGQNLKKIAVASISLQQSAI